jgi:hypothetical protein
MRKEQVDGLEVPAHRLLYISGIDRILIAIIDQSVHFGP